MPARRCACVPASYNSKSCGAALLDGRVARPHTDIGYGDSGGQERIFSEVFEIPTTHRRTIDVQAGGENKVHSACPRILAHGDTKSPRKIRVPRGRQCNAGWICEPVIVNPKRTSLVGSWSVVARNDDIGEPHARSVLRSSEKHRLINGRFDLGEFLAQVTAGKTPLAVKPGKVAAAAAIESMRRISRRSTF